MVQIASQYGESATVFRIAQMDQTRKPMVHVSLWDVVRITGNAPIISYAFHMNTCVMVTTTALMVAMKGVIVVSFLLTLTGLFVGNTNSEATKYLII